MSLALHSLVEHPFILPDGGSSAFFSRRYDEKREHPYKDPEMTKRFICGVYAFEGNLSPEDKMNLANRLIGKIPDPHLDTNAKLRTGESIFFKALTVAPACVAKGLMENPETDIAAENKPINLLARYVLHRFGGAHEKQKELDPNTMEIIDLLIRDPRVSVGPDPRRPTEIAALTILEGAVPRKIFRQVGDLLAQRRKTLAYAESAEIYMALEAVRVHLGNDQGAGEKVAGRFNRSIPKIVRSQDGPFLPRFDVNPWAFGGSVKPYERKAAACKAAELIFGMTLNHAVKADGILPETAEKLSESGRKVIRQRLGVFRLTP